MMKNNQNKFMFFENFLKAIEQLPKEEQATACLEFCKYGISGKLPDNKYLAMFCLGVSASVQKYQGRGGAREGAGRPKKQEKQELNENQNIQKNQNIQTAQTETETKNIKHKMLVSDNWYPDEKTINKLKEKNLNVDKVVDKFICSCQAKNLKYIDFNKAILSWNWDNDNTLKQEKAEETVFIDEHTRIDEQMPEFKDMTYDECCRAFDWLQEKMYCQSLSKSKFVEIVRKFKGIK